MAVRTELAPLEGITTWLFRRTHARMFGGADRYFTPFFSPAAEHILTKKELRDLAPEQNAGVPTVPQVSRGPCPSLHTSAAPEPVTVHWAVGVRCPP